MYVGKLVGGVRVGHGLVVVVSVRGLLGAGVFVVPSSLPVSSSSRNALRRVSSDGAAVGVAVVVVSPKSKARVGSRVVF